MPNGSSSSSADDSVDLDIVGVPEDKETTHGGVVVKKHDDNGAERKGIMLMSGATTGNVILTTNSNKVKVFPTETGGAALTFDGSDNKFGVGILPKPLYVEGATESGTMRDVTLTLTLTHDTSGKTDAVTFTVLWVTVTAKHTGNVADDNSARDAYQNLGVPGSFALGYRLNSTDGSQIRQIAWKGIGSEFIGTVAPNNFVPSDFGGGIVKLKRERVEGKQWYGNPNGNENQIPYGYLADDSATYMRDDNPQSGGSNGKIYDLDAPGLDAHFSSTLDIIHRLRTNFRAWADYNGTRCSTKIEWNTRSSTKLTGAVDSGTAESGTANTITDNNKSWAVDQWAPGAILITFGPGAPQVRRVTGNTATTITVATNWDIPPGDTSEYLVINAWTWVQENGVANDNRNANGTTNLSWDLT